MYEDDLQYYKTKSAKMEEELLFCEEQLKELKKENERLQWELNKTREDLDYFANLKITAIRGSEPR